MSADLIDWLRACLDTTERIARECPFSEWEAIGPTPAETWLCGRRDPNHSAHLAKPVPMHDRKGASIEHAAHNDPARVLRQVAAHRKIINRWEMWLREQAEARTDYVEWIEGRTHPGPPRRTTAEDEGKGLEIAVRHLASIYSDMPGWRESWDGQ